MMVAPFDSAAFSMAEGVISRPIETSYGWHIIEVTGHRPMKSRQEMEGALKGILMNSEKGHIPQQRFMEKMTKKYNGKIIDKNLDQIKEMIVKNPGGYDSTMIATLSAMNLPIAHVNSKDFPVSAAMVNIAQTASTDAQNAIALLRSAAKALIENEVRQQARIDLVNSNPDYRNLINEYSDGILLFDISQDKVWQKASQDREGLENYFRRNKAKYAFDEPRYKAVIVFTTSDSLETEVKNYLNSLDKTKVNTATIGKELREKFGKNVRAERVIAKKGENAITDYLAFGGPKPSNQNISWSNYFAFMDSIIDAPVEADDVKSKVTTDYQSELEKNWIQELRSKYPVKIDKKVLKTVKEIK